jgi:cob(I)alamin adenosyltransferase
VTRIYTRTGDVGETGLFGGGRVPKDDVRVESYGEVDELNAALGMARAEGLGKLDALAQTLQDQLFTVGAVLATPGGSQADAVIPHVRLGWVDAMEKEIDALEAELKPLQSFILPGGTKAAAALHLARTICRRAERKIVPLVRGRVTSNEVMIYMNRLSDLLFVMARVANHRANTPDVPWVPHKD